MGQGPKPRECGVTRGVELKTPRKHPRRRRKEREARAVGAQRATAAIGRPTAAAATGTPTTGSATTTGPGSGPGARGCATTAGGIAGGCGGARGGAGGGKPGGSGGAGIGTCQRKRKMRSATLPFLKFTDTRARERAWGRGARGRDGLPPAPVLIREKHVKWGAHGKKKP